MDWLNSQIEWLLIQEPGSLLVASLGWPAISLSMLLSIAGVYFKKSRLLIIAALLILPVSLYLLGANNWISIIFPFFPVLLIACWYTVRHNLVITSWSLLIVTSSGFSYLAYLVINQ
jgi:hypothetical protein